MKQTLAFIIALMMWFVIVYFFHKYSILESDHYKDIQQFNQIEAFLTQPYNLRNSVAK